MAVCFLQSAREMLSKSCKYMRSNSTRQKDFNFTIVKFRVQRYGDMWPKKVGKPWREERRCTLYAGMVSKEFANFVLKDDRQANSRDVNTLETFWIFVDETTYKDPAPKTLDELRQRLRFAWKNVNLDTLSELIHSIPHSLKNVRNIKEDILMTNILVSQCKVNKK